MGKTTLYSLLAVIFPPQCLHCKELHDKLFSFLCNTCISLLEVQQGTVVFDSLSPVSSLLDVLKQKGCPQMAKLLAAYMAFQYAHSSDPFPDLVIAVPSAWWIKPTASLLAQQLANILNIPFIPLLRRGKQLLRQEQGFVAHHQAQGRIRGKTVLLIDDTFAPAAALNSCAEKLWEKAPKAIIKRVLIDYIVD